MAKPLFNLIDSEARECSKLVSVSKRLAPLVPILRDGRVVLYYPGGDIDTIAAMVTLDADIAVGTSKWSVNKLANTNQELRDAFPTATEATLRTFSNTWFFVTFVNALVHLEPTIETMRQSSRGFYIRFTWNGKQREIFYYNDLDYFSGVPPILKKTSFNVLYVEMENPPDHVKRLVSATGNPVLVIDQMKDSGRTRVQVPYCTAYFLEKPEMFHKRTVYYRLVKPSKL